MLELVIVMAVMLIVTAVGLPSFFRARFLSSADKRAVVRNGQIVARTIMTVTLSVDHRAVDGANASEFLSSFRRYMEEPGMMLV